MKTLIIIPAYNEEENIQKVINELKRDIKKVDILVINDCSKDNTEKILMENKINYINNIYNMGYAMSVQTGLKYAKKHGYDYVIQMDADGQHIAKEALKLYDTAVKENVDIVIGSRYLKDLGYPCPPFRRIGTKMFSLLVRLFCKQKIADPLSGFQCLNKSVIERYSSLGEYPEYPDANLVIDMLLRGYTVKEVPVKMRVREAGTSMHSGIFKNIRYMVIMLYSCVIIAIKNIGRKKVK